MFYNRFQPFADNLSTTSASIFIQGHTWIVATIQTIHILAISTAVGAVLMTTLRILGFAGRSQSMAATTRRFLPWLWWSVVVLAITGVVMIVGEPVRELLNPAFWAKMAMLALSLLIAFGFHRSVRGNVAAWEMSHERRLGMRIAVVLALSGWIGIIFLGRWIAYMQADI